MKDFDDLMKEQQESWEKLRLRHEQEFAKFQTDFELKMEKFDSNIEDARRIGRETMSRVVTLSATIVGFSVTLLSIEQLNLLINVGGLRLSWVLFLITITLGLLIPYLESRAKLVVHWRSIQQQDWERKLNLQDKLMALVVVKYSVFIAPRNLIYCKIYKTDEEQKQNAQRNAQVIHWTHKVINTLLFLELIFILTFIAALSVLLFSVRM